MLLGKQGAAYERELHALKKKEERLLTRRLKEEASFLEQKLEGKVPKRLEGSLRLAFTKAFSLVFSKGTSLIEKTYSKDNLSQDFEKLMLDVQEHEDRASLRRLSKGAQSSAQRHVLLATAEGTFLGLLGIGLADIPLFSALLLRNLYETALSYGFSYDTPIERLFILRIIEVSLLRGEDFAAANKSFNSWIDDGVTAGIEEAAQIRNTAAALSAHLLYLKFIQGIPLIGVVGGLSDSLCLHRVSHYARLKYKRRFLQQGRVHLARGKLD